MASTQFESLDYTFTRLRGVLTRMNLYQEKVQRLRRDPEESGRSVKLVQVRRPVADVGVQTDVGASAEPSINIDISRSHSLWSGTHIALSCASLLACGLLYLAWFGGVQVQLIHHGHVPF